MPRVAVLFVFLCFCGCDRERSSGADASVPDAAFTDGSTDSGTVPDASTDAQLMSDADPPDAVVDAELPVMVTAEAQAGCRVACMFTYTCVLRMPAAQCVEDCLTGLPAKTQPCLSAYEAAGRCGDGMLCVQLTRGTCDAELMAIPDACE